MRKDGQDGKHNEALRRVVALLLALAGLAERAACRSRPVRCMVLWLLRPAERSAWAFAAEAGWAASPFVPVECPARAPGDGAGDAVRLAGRLRALAAVFSALIHRAALRLVRVARRPAPDCRCRGPNPAWLDRLPPALRPRRVDTS